MKYQYLYQDRQNQNQSGWIKARDRADAYTLLRKQGIRPYRIIGNDPVRWQPWVIGGVVVVLGALCLVLGARIWWGDAAEAASTLPRQQLGADASKVALASPLDQYLLWFAQPGKWVERPEVTEEELAEFQKEFDSRVPGAWCEVQGEKADRLTRVLAGMHREMADFIGQGYTLKDYCAFLEQRQGEEQEFRLKAEQSVSKAPESYRELVWTGVNTKLRERGMEEIPRPKDLPNS